MNYREGWQTLRDALGYMRVVGGQDARVDEITTMLHATPWDGCIPMCAYVRLYQHGGEHVQPPVFEGVSVQESVQPDDPLSCPECGLDERHDDSGRLGDSYDQVRPHRWDDRVLTITGRL